MKLSYEGLEVTEASCDLVLLKKGAIEVCCDNCIEIDVLPLEKFKVEVCENNVFTNGTIVGFELDKFNNLRVSIKTDAFLCETVHITAPIDAYKKDEIEMFRLNNQVSVIIEKM